MKLVHGRFPADPKVVAAVGGGYDLFLSKNTLKRGFVHPDRPAKPETQLQLGVSDDDFVEAVSATLKPGGWCNVLIEGAELDRVLAAAVAGAAADLELVDVVIEAATSTTLRGREASLVAA